MKVEDIWISNFRSVASCELGSCNGFNVLIGKNNSGKSNILSAIHAFFQVVGDGDIVSLDPPIGKDIDFHKKNVEARAEVALIFALSEAERSELMAGIIEDYPQMTNVVHTFDPELRLNVRIGFDPSPNAYACVNRISLVSINEYGEPNLDSEKIILDVDLNAALRLYERYRQYQHDDGVINALQQYLTLIDREDWARMRRDLNENVSALRRFHGLSARVPPEPDAQRLTESMLRDSTTYEEFRDALQSQANTLTRYAGNSDKHDLDQESVRTFSGRESTIPGHVLRILQRLSEVKVLYVTDDRRPIGRDEAQRLLSLKMQRGGPEHLKRIQDIVLALLGVKIDAFSGGQMTRGGGLSAELDVDDFIVEVNGSGIKEALRLLLDIEFQDPSLLLVEEPEIHLHPALETTMMRYLKEVSQDRQVFITTHSTNFLDNAAMTNVYLVSKDESTKAQLLDQGQVEEQIPVELGIRLSSLFIYDRLVFVESQTDEEIIRAWAQTLGVNFNQSNVGFIHMDGARNLTYFAADSTLSFLARRKVKMWFMIDRDEKDEEEIRAIQERLGPNAIASVLQKREIENYLIHPRVLGEQIAFKQKVGGIGGGTSPDPEEIKAAIDEETDKLKSLTIFKRVAKLLCQPIYPSRSYLLEDLDGLTVEEKASEEIEVLEAKVSALKGVITQETNRQSQEVENDWEGRRLDIVPGDLLIDLVYKRYGVRFHKRRGDGIELAKMMQDREIAPELQSLIGNIGT